MRRITVWEHDHEKAAVALDWLNRQGYDVMGEDYASPDLQRRPPPQRRVEPERHEGGAGLLLRQPPKPPARKRGPGRKPGPIAEFVWQVLKETGSQTPDELVELAKDKGWPAKKVRDTIRRMKRAGHYPSPRTPQGK